MTTVAKTKKRLGAVPCDNREQVLSALRRGKAAFGTDRQIGKTSALLEFLHERERELDRALVAVPSEYAIRATARCWRDMYPGEDAPQIVAAYNIEAATRGLRKRLYVDEAWKCRIAMNNPFLLRWWAHLAQIVGVIE